jgi:ribosomal protein S12 methylthiotransferase
MEVQQRVAFEFAQAQIGTEQVVVIDGPDPEFANHFRGRTTSDSPDIDCEVRVKSKSLRAGDFTKVKITAADGYDLVAKTIGKPW